jgi:hypothetical protein
MKSRHVTPIHTTQRAHSRKGHAAAAPWQRDAAQRAGGNQALGQLLGGTRGSAAAGAMAPIVREVLQMPGEPLPASIRAEMEARFGADFRDVRVHDGAAAAASAAAIHAKAYTVGRDIAFGAGHYAPQTPGGEHLLAHELAHVVQQSRGGAAPLPDSDAGLEAGAEQAALAVSLGSGPVQVSGASGVGLARQDDDAQANQPLLSLLNGPFQGDYRRRALLTDILALPITFQSATDPQVGSTWLPALTLQVRDRLSPTSELGVFGTLGGTVPISATPGHPATGSGALGMTYHYGPEAPSDTAAHHFGAGFWLTVGQYWGLEPPPAPGAAVPAGRSFNPMANASLALGWARNEHSEHDLIVGTALGRWGPVNGASFGGFLSPYIGYSFTRNIGKQDSVFGEVTTAVNLGLAAGAGRFPASISLGLGVGYQHTMGDWGIGLEPWLFAEPWSDVSAPAANGFGPGNPFNYGGGLRFNVTAINPRRRRFDDE